MDYDGGVYRQDVAAARVSSSSHAWQCKPFAAEDGFETRSTRCEECAIFRGLKA